jgi:hypothetical protein
MTSFSETATTSSTAAIAIRQPQKAKRIYTLAALSPPAR